MMKLVPSFKLKRIIFSKIFPHEINSNQASAWPNSQILIHIYSHITRPDAETLLYTYTTIYIQTIYIHKIYYIVVGQHLHIAPDFIGLSQPINFVSFPFFQGKSGSPLLLRRDNAHIPSAALIGGSTLGKLKTINHRDEQNIKIQ